MEETKAFCICNPIISFIVGIQQIYFSTNILGPQLASHLRTFQDVVLALKEPQIINTESEDVCCVPSVEGYPRSKHRWQGSGATGHPAGLVAFLAWCWRESKAAEQGTGRA